MRISLIISSFLHVAVVAAAFFVLPETEKFEVKKSEAIQAETISESQFAKLTEKPDEKKPEKKPKQKPEPEKKIEPKKKEVKKAPPPPPPPPPEPEAPPEPKPPEQKPPEPAPPEPKVEAPPLPKPSEPKKEPEKKKAEVKPVPKTVPIPRVRPKFAKKKRKFNPQKLSALLDKLPEDKAEESSPQFSGRSATISASDKDLMRRRIGECWSPPTGLKDAEKLLVKVKIRLKRDGTLSRPPQIMSSISQAAADSAVRAIRRCVPYDMFPSKKYNTWREIVLNFDPSQMFGG